MIYYTVLGSADGGGMLSCESSPPKIFVDNFGALGFRDGWGLIDNI